MQAQLENPAIVIAAWNRPQSLQRLLGSLANANIPHNTKLHISIDYFPRNDVFEIASAFEWKFGDKIIEQHSENLGLRSHILHCGGLTQQYGAIILLEDDLIVSPAMYAYATKSLALFENEAQVAGISLYHYRVAESCHQPFEVWEDQWHNYFMQLPSSWGLVLSRNNWNDFYHWLGQNHQKLHVLPQYISAWTQQSWKKLFAAYLIATNKYFSFPKHALSTNTEEHGVHANTAGLFQVPLLMAEKNWNLALPNQVDLKYDAWFEPNADFIKKIRPTLSDYDFDVDLYGQKSAVERKNEFVLTGQKGGEALIGFAKAGFSNIYAIWAGREGADFRLVASNSELSPLIATDYEFNYYVGQSKSAQLHLPEIRLPNYSIIWVLGEDEHEYLNSFESFFDQDFEGLERIILYPDNKLPSEIWDAHCAGLIRLQKYAAGEKWNAIKLAIGLASATLVQVMESDVVLAENSISEVAKIFRQFPGLEWFSGLPENREGKALSQLMSFYRWDTPRFESVANNLDELERWLPISLQVFRKALLVRNTSDSKTELAFLTALSRSRLPSISSLHFASSGKWKSEHRPLALGAGKINQSRKYYFRHLPILWKLHRKWSNYCPVLRYDQKHNTWFEFEY